MSKARSVSTPLSLIFIQLWRNFQEGLLSGIRFDFYTLLLHAGQIAKPTIRWTPACKRRWGLIRVAILSRVKLPSLVSLWTDHILMRVIGLCGISVNCRQLSSSFDRSKELRKIYTNCRLSTLINSHQPSWNLFSCLTRTWELRKLPWKLSFINFCQLPCNSCSRLTRTW